MRPLITIMIVMMALCAHGATFNSDGSDTDVQSLINGASDGDIVTIPAGTFTWDNAVSISGKGIHLQGAGAGRVICNSLSAVTIGTGTKIFTVTNTLIDILQFFPTLHIFSIIDDTQFMEGTPTQYSLEPPNNLEMNITSTGGSGSHHYWLIATMPTTTIIADTGSTDLIGLTEDVSHTVEVSGIKIESSTANTGDIFQLTPTTGGRPIQIHNCWLHGGGGSQVKSTTFGGILYSNSFTFPDFSDAPLSIHIKGAPSTAWTTTSFWGDDDASGTNCFYVEDCDFHGWQNATDFDDSARAVVRFCWFDSAGFGTHGADTSNFGCRTTEAYKNYFEFHGFSDGTTLNNDKIFFVRGGSHLMYSNIWCTLGEGSDFGSKTEVTMMIENLNRPGGPNGCWVDPYHVPRQVGFGRVTGSGLDGQGRSTDSITYVGDIEPVYIWDNEVISGSETFSISPVNYTGSPNCGGGPDVSGFIQLNRDYFLSAKPSYTGYPYPHPLRATGEAPEPPAEVARVQKLKALKIPSIR